MSSAVFSCQAQVSMNLVDTEKTPLHRVFEIVKAEAAAHGVSPTWSEIVGLVPERVLLEAGARHVQLRGFSKAMLLETKVREVIAGGEAVESFMARVADAAPTPAVSPTVSSVASGRNSEPAISPPSTVGSTTNGPAPASHPLLETDVATLSDRPGPPAADAESGFDDDGRLSHATSVHSTTTPARSRTGPRVSRRLLRMENRRYVMRRTGQRGCRHGL